MRRAGRHMTQQRRCAAAQPTAEVAGKALQGLTGVRVSNGPHHDGPGSMNNQGLGPVRVG